MNDCTNKRGARKMAKFNNWIWEISIPLPAQVELAALFLVAKKKSSKEAKK